MHDIRTTAALLCIVAGVHVVSLGAGPNHPLLPARDDTADTLAKGRTVSRFEAWIAGIWPMRVVLLLEDDGAGVCFLRPTLQDKTEKFRVLWSISGGALAINHEAGGVSFMSCDTDYDALPEVPISMHCVLLGGKPIPFVLLPSDYPDAVALEVAKECEASPPEAASDARRQ